ncbi:complex I 24 kDa subunit family protein [Marinitoga litoralis]|uniref:NADH-quinone oxidoreductase subunit NuoE family protein n=1 Tax=Marinitoga litoralis TaxID=570855 RepID=UPI00195F7638|nr:NAD(P)H-dependent oxidoreductase subunit E [Marinitoga litoralis]MBM7558452.1 NADH-quinone oxidoreductase subunit E/NADP-reducing hydrogenase subunit HndA [Marinitoga litoralis]
MSVELESKLKEVEAYIDSLELEGKDKVTKRSFLIHVLHKAQEIIGYLPIEVQKLIAKKLDVHASDVYGVVTFYNFFTMKPKGKYPINVCLGTACYVRGSGDILEEFKKQLGIKENETTEDGLFSIHAVRCVGACGLAPVVMIGDEVHGRLTTKDVKKLIKEYKEKDNN